MYIVADSASNNHGSEFQIDNTVGRDDAVFIFHVLAEAKIDSSARVFNQEPASCDVPQTDSLFNVSVESSAGDVSHVERSAAEHSAFADTMNHLLEQRKICSDRLTCLGEPYRDHCFSQIGAVAYVNGI